MSRYKSFSVHSGICSCRKAVTSILAAVTAAALPLTILGVGTVGAILFKVSSLSARSMMPTEAETVMQEQEEETYTDPSEEELPVSSDEPASLKRPAEEKKTRKPHRRRKRIPKRRTAAKAR